MKRNPFAKGRIDRHLEYRRSPSHIYRVLADRGCNIPKGDFTKWHDSQLKKCSYCDMPEELISFVQFKHDQRLQIDRLDPKKGYIIGNMCLCCAMCNAVKGNWFTAQQMREIGQKYIKPKWDIKPVIEPHEPTVHKGFHLKSINNRPKIFVRGKFMGYGKRVRARIWVKNKQEEIT